MLYLVATPIGNLGDLSFRALEVLKSVDEIACEDTRHSLGLLNKYGVKKPLFSYHKFNEKEKAGEIVEKLKRGVNIALITDAGTPVISDPGNVLIKTLIEEGLEFTLIPGACALISALVLSGLDASRFCFLGFLPEKQGERNELLLKYKSLDMTIIFYSAPHDLQKNLKSVYEVFGDRTYAAVREITKMHESIEISTLKDGYNKEPKGEYVVVIDKGETQNPLLALSEKEHIDYYLKQGIDKKEALKKVAKERGVSKSSLYKYTL